METRSHNSIKRRKSISTPIKIQAEDHFLFKQSSQCLINSFVRIYDDAITIQQQESPYQKFKVQFDFDTIFQILRKNINQQQQKTSSGIPYGIKFQKFQEETEILNYQKPQIVLKWKDLLKKKLNQRNFHQIFKPIKKIGQGNFASVYLVSKYQDKKLYAVKAFSKQLQYDDQRGKQCLQNQIQIMRSLNHDNLMKLQGVYQTNNSLYFVVQYLSGGLLFDKIYKKHTFTKEQITQVIESILKGVEAMHKIKIMHRDLKPQNILFRDQESFQCVIADFGLATFTDVDQYLFTRCGTPGYVAPQISNLKSKNAHYDAVCDVFSVGVIFHIILLGQSPFPGTSADQVLKQNRQCNINFDDQMYKKLAPKCLDLLKRMLQKNPYKRITAEDALKHDFFSQLDLSILEELPVQKQGQCDSPLMMSRNVNRKRNLRLRDDSCLKFKMKQNIQYNDQQQKIQKINSPLKKRIGRPRHERNSKTSTPSGFKQ